MKKVIINESWENEIIEDTSSFFVLIFKQGSNTAGYIKNYSIDDKIILSDYTNLVNQYNNVKFEEPTSIIIVKLPSTSQVKALLSEATYTGDATNETKLEIINHLLNRADCEYIKETVLMSLEEAKKKKKKKRKAPKVTYTMGWPWYNDHRFNHGIGSCDCNKEENPGEDAADNVNDAIGGGESAGDASSGEGLGSGDFGGGEGGAIGESLNEASMTPLQKMQALENGTRGFNAAAASDQKLLDNLLICAKNNLDVAGRIMVAEIAKRMAQGTWQLGAIPGFPKFQNQSNPLITIKDSDIHPADLLFIEENKLNIKLILENITNAPNSLKQAIITLLFAISAGYAEVTAAVKEWILNEITKKDFKQIITSCKSDQKLLDRLTDICNEFITEGVYKMNNLNESKRYIKRYYIRPQNIFCSNKAEILSALVKEVGENNCSVYSLKALDDHDDVHLLQPKDIIYYYNDGILYDKNHVKVMDYDLNVKHEEDRKKFGNVDAISDQTFDAEYEDRLTESFESINEFALDFTDVNAYGEKLHEGKVNEFVCCICGEEVEGYGNNPSPVKEDGKCCDACNKKFVIPARLNIEIED